MSVHLKNQNLNKLRIKELNKGNMLGKSPCIQ